MTTFAKATVEIKYDDHTYTGTVHLTSDLDRYLSNETRTFTIGKVELIRGTDDDETNAFEADLQFVLKKHVKIGAIIRKEQEGLEKEGCGICESNQFHYYRQGGETYFHCRNCGSQYPIES